MEGYKKVLRRRRVLLGALALLAVGLGIYDVFFASEAMQNSAVFGFQCGAATALGALAAVMLVRYGRLLRDPARLQAAYNWEQDERLRAIRAKAGMPMLLFTSIGMAVAGVIAGYVNLTVGMTLVLAATAQLLVGAVVKGVYTRRM